MSRKGGNMISFHLKDNPYKNHPLDEKWGRLLHNDIYKNHLCTVIDNQNEERVLLLLHLSPNVRKYVYARLYRDFLYVGIWHDAHIPTYTNWEYTYQALGESEIIRDLESVLYELEPTLQTHTLVGYQGDDLFDDPNTYTGTYVLNDEKEYTIERVGTSISFCRDNNVIYEGALDVNRFRKAISKYNLRLEICSNIDKLLSQGILSEKVQQYIELV